MFERLFDRPAIQRQHAGCPHAQLLERYACQLLDAGYCRFVVWRQLGSWERFVQWLARQRRPIEEINESVVQEFLAYAAGQCRKRGNKEGATTDVVWHRPALGNLLRFLRSDQRIAPALQVEPIAWHASGLASYGCFLREHRGLSQRVITLYLKEAAAFLATLPVGSWPELAAHLRPGILDEYIVRRASTLSPGSIKMVTCSLRSVLRYWFTAGILNEELAAKVYTPRQYRLASLPKAMAWPDIEKVLGGVGRDTPAGRRDYAMLLLMATYGWRACEVARLKLEDIDWRRRVIHICHGKSGRHGEFPLLEEVGEALIQYLREGRPASTRRQVFLGVRAPFRPFASSTALFHATRKWIRRAGLKPPRMGAHTLRHSRAVALLAQGATLKTIGDLLGHRDPESTQIYTKVDLNGLREVALGAGEVRP